MKNFTPPWLLAAPFIDFLAALAGYFIARSVRPITDGIPFLHSYFDPKFIPDLDFFIPFVVCAAVAFVACVALNHGYSRSFQLPVWQIFLGTIVWGLVLIAYFALLHKEVIFSRMMLAQAMFFTLLLSVAGRLVIQIIHQKYAKPKCISIIGPKATLKSWQEVLAKNQYYRTIEICTHFREMSKRKNIDELWLLQESREEADEIASWCNQKHITLCWQPQWQMALSNVELQLIDGRPLLRAHHTPLDGWGRIGKRLIDIFGAGILLIMLMPVFAIIAAGIKRDSPGGIFYSSKRVGKAGAKFSMHKFRTMIDGADQLKEKLQQQNHRQDGPFFKMKNDPRITSFGRFLRRFSLDELPQLWNVLRGDMSLIGPRPHLPDEIAELSPQLQRILAIKPGISGLAQVSGRSDLPFQQEMQLDLYYIQHWSLVLDGVIFVKSIIVVLGGRGAD